MTFVRVVVKNRSCGGVGFLLFYFVGTDCKSALSSLVKIVNYNFFKILIPLKTFSGPYSP